MFKRSHAKILKHHRHSSVYVEGRYLHVDTRISTRSKRGREIARETAQAILAEVGANETSFQFHNSEPATMASAPGNAGQGADEPPAGTAGLRPVD